MRAAARRRALGALLPGLLLGACTQGGVEVSRSGVRIDGFELVEERSLAPTVTESTYRARCVAGTERSDDAVVFAASNAPGVVLVDAVAHCGELARNADVLSADTIVLHRDPAGSFDPNAMDWVVLAFGPATRVLSEPLPGGARRLRYEVEITGGGGRAQPLAAGISSRAAEIDVTDGLVTGVMQPVGTVRNRDSFELVLAPATALDPLALEWTLSLGVRSEFALGVTRTLDGDGQPLGEVAVDEMTAAGTIERSSEARTGIATLAESAGSFRWMFRKDGHLPVWREATLAIGQVAFVPSPWLAPRNPQGAPISVLNGGAAEQGGARVRFDGGVLPAASVATLTELGPQTLPALLPAGWSPLAAFWLELGVEPRVPAQAELRLAARLAAGERAFLARFDPATLRWIDTGAAVAVAGDVATAPIAASGAYAVVAPDRAPTTPPTPIAGQPLEATDTPFPLADGLTADGSVTPPVAAASADPALVVARAEVAVSHAGPLPSGLVLRTDVDEQYALRDGSIDAAPSYETFFVAHQRPGDDDPHTLHAAFPLRPQLAIGPDELDEASVTLGVLPVSGFEGGFFDAGGGRVGTRGVFLAAPPGAVSAPRAVELRAIDPGRFGDALPPGAALVAFDLAADGLAPGTRLAAGFGPQEPDAHFVLARFVQSGGRSGLEPRERFASDEFGVLRSTEPASGASLPGVTGSGTYVLVRTSGPQALVRGIARDTQGQAIAGLAVEIEGEPWLTFSAAGGAFALVAPPGARDVVVTDLRSGDRGVAGVALADATSVAAADVATQPAGPRVVTVDPADGATNVRASAPITVVFSERIAPPAVEDLVLTDAVGNVVPTTLSTNLARTEATLLPVNPLAAGALHTLTLAATIADLAGLALEGERSFQFTTQSLAVRGAGAELTSWEPGAQTSACDGVPGFDAADGTLSCVVGGAGTADPNASVVIVNETRGTTATVLAGPDGSFTNFIEADVDDFIAATFVNGNGTRIRIPLSRQLFDDGSVALFQGGGILEAESDGGPVQVLIEPGTIKDKNKFKVEPLDTAELLSLLEGSLPEDAQLLGGAMRFTVEGEAPDGPSDLSFPVDPSTLDLPAGVPPERGAFAAAVVREQSDGSKVYEVVDKLRYEDGRITSNTFPFLGLLFLGAALDGADVFTAMVVPIFLGADPATVTGRVLECPGGQCLGLDAIAALQVGRPLVGAFVSLRPPTTENSLAGRLDPGMVYATSGPDGRYALVAQSLASGYVLTATHPKHARPVSEPVLGLFDLSISGAIEKNLVFSAPFPGSINGPVRVNAAHTPVYPGPGQPATLQVNAYHGAGAPTVAISLERVESLVEGVEATPQDVTLGTREEENLSATRKRVTLDVTGDPEKALLAVLRIRASVSSTDPTAQIAPKEILHAIALGVGPPPPGDNDVIAADDNDEIGPMVVTTIPSDGAVAVAPGDEILLFFNEPIDRGIEDDPSAITIAGGGSGPAAFTVELAADQRVLVVRPGPLTPDTDYTLAASTGVRDVSGNDLDQEPGVSGSQSFTLQFRTARQVVAPLPTMESGGGAVLGRGAFLYALDRASAGPALVVFDVSDPTSPSAVRRIALPGTPRDLVFIPAYPHVLRDGDSPRTHDLVAVVGGDLGSASVDDDGSVFTPPQYLRVFDVDSPSNPQLVESTVLSQRVATITKVEWRPPFLVYLESGADAQFVTPVLLQEAILGHHLTPAELEELPLFGVREIDANGDGDFVDDGDRLPVPNPSAEFFGKRETCLVDETNQRILDFDYERGFCAVTLSAGQLRAVGGGLGADVPPQYRTITSEGQPIDRVQASVSFGASARPKRVDVVFNVLLEIDASVEARNLALVSLSPDADGTPALAVIDVSLPGAPELLVKIPFAEELGLGQLQSVTQRPDGLLALATSTSIVLLDPTRLALPVPAGADQLHPAVLGVVREAGSGAQSNDGNAAGVNVVSLGARNQVVLSSPRLSIVNFGGSDPLVDPSALVNDDDAIAAELERMRAVGSVAPARLRATGGATATLDPPSRTVHYHVIADIPGGAGPEVKLALESLNRAGRPLANLGRNFPPVRAVASGTSADLDQEARSACDAPIRSLRAFRLASDPASPYYNRYLSLPFAVTYERVTEAELALLRDTPPREILWSGHFVRASIDPDESSDAVLAPFTSLVDAQEKVIRPGTSAVARSLSALYVLGPNPPPPGGGVQARGSLGMLNAGNGEVRHRTLDMTLPSKRMPIAFQRAIGGQDLHEGPFGRGWDSSYAQKIVPLDGEVFPAGQMMPLVERASDEGSERARSRDVLLQTGNASVVLFRHAGTSAPPELASDPLLDEQGWLAAASDFYLPQRGVFDALLRFPDGQYLRVTPDGTQFWYAAGGRLERIYHRYESNRHILAYNERDELAKVIDASVDEDRFVEVGYWRFGSDPLLEAGLDEETDNAFVAGKIARLRDSVGRDVLFFYNEDGLLERREGYELDGGNGGFSGRSTTTYLSSDQCSGDLEGVVAGAGSGGASLFDASLSDTGAQPAATSASGAFGALVFTPPGTNNAAAAEGAQTSVTAAGITTAYTFDAFGNPSSIEMSGPNAAPVTYGPSFDEHGRLLRMTHPAGNAVEYTYDADNQNLRSRGNLLAVKRVAGSRGGADITETFAYDERYNQLSGAGSDGAGNPITYTLNASGKDVESIDYGGDGTRVIERFADGQIRRIESPDGVVVEIAYDGSSGFKTSETLGGHVTGYGYDGSIAGRLGLPTTISHPSGEPTEVSYDARGLTTEVARGGRSERTAYDENGNPVSIERTTGAGNVVETRVYDQLGFLESRSFTGTEPDFSITFEPDATRNVAKVNYPGGSEERAWDHQGNLSQRKLGSLVTDYVRDANGNVVEVREGGELVSSLTLDGHDRVIEIAQQTGGGGPNVFEFGYDGNGVVTSTKVTDAEHGVVAESVSNDVDALGRVRSLDRIGDQASGGWTFDYQPGNGLTLTAVGPHETVTRVRDAAGRTRTVTDGIGTVTYAHDPNGNVLSAGSTEDSGSFSLIYGYDGLDHVTSLDDGIGPIASFVPRIDGTAESRSDGLGNTIQQTWTALGEPTSQTRANGVGTTFAYDASRQLAAAGDLGGGGETYTPDAAVPFRIGSIARSGGGGFDVNGRDARGNPTGMSIPGGTMNATYDLLNRPLTRSISFAGSNFDTTYAYDALDRVRVATYPGGSTTYAYDPLGPLVSATFEEGGETFAVGQGIRGDGVRTRLDYPSGVSASEGRDAAGRITSIGAAGVSSVVTPGGRGFVASATLGSTIQETREHDGRRRPVSIRYDGPGGPLAEVRYQWDAADNPEARQELHRGGRADVFGYDTGNRLVAAHVDARPASGADEPRALASPPLGFAPGRFARSYAYDGDGLDLLTDAVVDDPDGLPAPLFAISRGAHDAQNHANSVDGFTREPDALGNTARTQLAVRDACPGPAPCSPVLVPAELTYDGAGHLVRVEREDGVTVEYDYQHTGLFHRRRVIRDGTLESERAYVWNDGVLLEEWEVSSGRELVARYFYRDEDAPFAAELLGPSGLETFYYLRDAAHSVMVVADAGGSARERVHYDPFGQPVIEAADATAPRIARVVATGDGARVELSEPITAPLAATPATGLVTSAQDVSGAVTVLQGASAVAAQTTLEEAAPGFQFGSVLRVRYAHQVGQALTLRIDAGGVVDEWSNPVAQETVGFTDLDVDGVVLFAATPLPQTAAAPLRRSALGSPILFHGQWFDYDTGLLFLRARFYDPYTGQFLQRDAAGYAAGPNHYAGFANNPVAHRDPSGLLFEKIIAIVADFFRGGARPVKPVVEGLDAADDFIEQFLLTEGRQIIAQQLREGRAVTDVSFSRQELRQIAEEVLQEEGRRFADSVVDRVTRLQGPEIGDARFSALRRLAWEEAGLSTEALSDTAFRALAAEAGDQRRAGEGFMRLHGGAQNPARVVEGTRTLAIDENLVDAVRLGNPYHASGALDDEAPSLAVLVGNFQHEVGETALQRVNRATRDGTGRGVFDFDASSVAPMWRRMVVDTEWMRAQTHFEQAFLARMRELDAQFADDVAPLVRTVE